MLSFRLNEIELSGIALLNQKHARMFMNQETLPILSSVVPFAIRRVTFVIMYPERALPESNNHVEEVALSFRWK
jgi:hypothetical protein